MKAKMVMEVGRWNRGFRGQAWGSRTSQEKLGTAGTGGWFWIIQFKVDCKGRR